MSGEAVCAEAGIKGRAFFYAKKTLLETGKVAAAGPAGKRGTRYGAEGANATGSAETPRAPIFAGGLGEGAREGNAPTQTPALPGRGAGVCVGASKVHEGANAPSEAVGAKVQQPFRAAPCAPTPSASAPTDAAESWKAVPLSQSCPTCGTYAWKPFGGGRFVCGNGCTPKKEPPWRCPDPDCGALERKERPELGEYACLGCGAGGRL